MARDKCDPITLLTAVVTRLRSVLALDESSCFISLTPRVKLRGAGDLAVIVSPLGGAFSEAMMEGGGQEQVTAEAGIAVTIRSYLQLDEAGHDATVLNDTSLGIVRNATGVLKALTVWDPLDADGDQLLRDMMMPTHFDFGKDDRTKLVCELQFSTNFDWDLSVYETPE